MMEGTRSLEVGRPPLKFSITRSTVSEGDADMVIDDY
jgi:hypothetical protein